MMSFQNVHDILFKEHEEQYDHFTRLMLTLSVGFITFTTAMKSGDLDGYGLISRLAIASHGLSILFGVWLQFILVHKPLLDLNRLAKDYSSLTKTTGYFARPPSRFQTLSFHFQVAFFLLAFFLAIAQFFIQTKSAA